MGRSLALRLPNILLMFLLIFLTSVVKTFLLPLRLFCVWIPSPLSVARGSPDPPLAAEFTLQGGHAFNLLCLYSARNARSSCVLFCNRLSSKPHAPIVACCSKLVAKVCGGPFPQPAEAGSRGGEPKLGADGTSFSECVSVLITPPDGARSSDVRSKV